MKVFLCVDLMNGMMFNNRRQSKDSAVINDILACRSGRLFIDKYSEPLFMGESCEYAVSDDPLTDASENDSCFIENRSIKKHIDKINSLIIYCWNKKYPADFYLDLDLSASPFKLQSVSELTGSSHDKITKEIYLK